MNKTTQHDRIRELNDAFRKTFIGGRACLTQGVNALSDGARSAIIQKVLDFADFTPDNDPHREHDFGSFEFEGDKFFWKIDLYEAGKVKRYFIAEPLFFFAVARS